MRRKIITQPQFQTSYALSYGLAVLTMALLIGGAMIGSLYLLSGSGAVGSNQTEKLTQIASGLWVDLGVIALVSLGMSLLIGFYLSHKSVGANARLESWLENLWTDGGKRPLGVRVGDDLKNLEPQLNDIVKAQEEDTVLIES